ncbi:MAG: FAD-dependent oxidoreductase [Hyphomonadaceae bacterium]
MTKPRLVVIGGGLGGHKIAHALQSAMETVLIDPKSFWEIPMAMPRQLVRPAELDSIVAFQRFLPKARHIQARAVAVTPEFVRVDGGEDVRFDYLVVATGANYRSALVKPLEGDAASRIEYYRSLNAQVTAAGRILIVGAGPIGVEIAGELSEEFPEKIVTLMEREGRLLPHASEKLSRWAAEALAKRGVNLVVGDELLSPVAPGSDVDTAGGEAVTRAGRRIAYDLALWCLGARSDARFLAESFPDAVNDRGEVIVNACLQAAGAQNVFALGDATNFPAKGGVPLHGQVKVMQRNLLEIARVGPTARLLPFKPPAALDLAVISLGRNAGVMKLPFGEFRTGWMARAFKSRDMLVGHLRKDVGV